MNEQDNGGPAFPGEYDNVFVDGAGEREPFKIAARQKGMTLRDYFAAKAMTIVWHAFDEGYTGSINVDEFDSDALAKHAYQIADAMLKARQK